MAYTEKRGDYYRARYKDADGKYPAVKDELGTVIKFRTEREARIAAQDAAAAVRAAVREAALKRMALPSSEVVLPPTFGEYVARWFVGQESELAKSTLENYRDHIEGHLLPAFADFPMPSVDKGAVDVWEAREKTLYAVTSVQTYRSVLHVIMEDAIEEGAHPGPNPARRKRGRGRRTGHQHRGPEKAVTSPLGMLLIAERASILSGRDDEFVQVIAKAYTGMRWGEMIGLAPKFVRDESIRIEYQLYQLRYGGFELCPPKDGSYRTIDCPKWLIALLRELMALNPPEPCRCHGREQVFRSGALQPGSAITRAEIARWAGVSAGTVSRALTGGQVSSRTRETVRVALEALQLKHGALQYEDHWKRAAFRASIWVPAVSGWYSTRGKSNPARPVRVAADPWPGQVIRGRYSADHADACWAPIEPDLTEHGGRHTAKTWWEELGTPKVLMDERMGHVDGSVSARYSHVTDTMRLRLMEGLTALWEASLAARYAMCPTSPVPILDRLLRDYAARQESKIISRISPSLGEIRRLIPRQIARDLRKLQSGEISQTSYFMKSPPVQYFDDEALANVEKFIKGEVER
ncbi:tyrosine-type recombinase/integrase [Streptomyces cinereoruber]